MAPKADADEAAWRAVRDDVKAHLDDILRDWERITAEEPWMSLPETYRLDHLPTVSRALCDVALTRAGGTPEQYRSFVWAAVTHGETRRHQKFAQELLFTEHYLVRHAMWRYLVRTQTKWAGDAAVRLDAAVTVGTRASLMGFHRAEFEERGRWPDVVEEVVREAPVQTDSRE